MYSNDISSTFFLKLKTQNHKGYFNHTLIMVKTNISIVSPVSIDSTI